MQHIRETDNLALVGFPQCCVCGQDVRGACVAAIPEHRAQQPCQRRHVPQGQVKPLGAVGVNSMGRITQQHYAAGGLPFRLQQKQWVGLPGAGTG